MLTARQISLWGDKLRDISAEGLSFNDVSVHDRERYQRLQDLAMEMMAAAAGGTLEELEPLRDIVFSRRMPMCGGDAAVIDNEGRILLIQHSRDGKWAMPGGAFQVGETPAEGAVREALEETGLKCEPVALVGVFDSRFQSSPTRFHLYQFVFLCRPLTGHDIGNASHAHETLDVGWFTDDALPRDLHPAHVSPIPQAFRVWRGETSAFFDK